MSAPNASSSSSQLVAYAQDIDYTRTEGFKQFKARYNVKNARATCNDPNGVYPSPEVIYQTIKGPGMTERSLDSLSLDDFVLVLGFVCPGSYTHTQTVEGQPPLGVISAGDTSHT